MPVIEVQDFEQGGTTEEQLSTVCRSLLTTARSSPSLAPTAPASRRLWSRSWGCASRMANVSGCLVSIRSATAASCGGGWECSCRGSQLPDRIKVWEALDLYSSFYRASTPWPELIEQLGLTFLARRARGSGRCRAVSDNACPWRWRFQAAMADARVRVIPWRSRTARGGPGRPWTRTRRRRIRGRPAPRSPCSHRRIVASILQRRSRRPLRHRCRPRSPATWAIVRRLRVDERKQCPSHEGGDTRRSRGQTSEAVASGALVGSGQETSRHRNTPARIVPTPAMREQWPFPPSEAARHGQARRTQCREARDHQHG